MREKLPKSHNGVRSLLLDPVTVEVLTAARKGAYVFFNNVARAGSKVTSAPLPAR